jgi:hypothetical protein
MNNYPERIEAALLEIFDVKRKLGDRRASMRSLEINVTVHHSTAKDPTTGKLLLTNETQRTSAIAKHLEEDEDYRAQLSEVRDLELQLAQAEASLERLRMEFRVHMLDAERNNAIAALKVADSIFYARHTPVAGFINGRSEPEVELPF